MVRDKETLQLSSVQLPSRVQLFATPWTAVHRASLSITNSRRWLKLMSIKLVMPSNHLILSSPSPPAFNLSQHQELFWWVSSSHQVAKVLENSALASVLPMNIQDWFPLGLIGLISLQTMGLSRVFSNTTVQKASILQRSDLDHLHFIKVKVLLSKTRLTLCSPINN